MYILYNCTSTLYNISFCLSHPEDRIVSLGFSHDETWKNLMMLLAHCPWEEVLSTDTRIAIPHQSLWRLPVGLTFCRSGCLATTSGTRVRQERRTRSRAWSSRWVHAFVIDFMTVNFLFPEPVVGEDIIINYSICPGRESELLLYWEGGGKTVYDVFKYLSRGSLL